MSAYKSVRWTALSTGTRAILGVLQIVVLARLLDPSSFGIQALALTVINSLVLFTDFGLSNAVIQKKDVTESELHSLFWLNVSIGLVLGLLLLLTAPAIARFYHKVELEPVLATLSAAFLILAFGQQAKALAEKNFLFNSLARIEILANAAGVGAAIACALFGAEVFSLVIGFLTTATLSSLGYLAISGWRSYAIPYIDFKEIKDLVNFGGRSVLVSIANLLGAQADTIIMGRFFTATTVGLYAQPRELTFRAMMAVNPIVTRIGFPLIAKAQGNIDDLSRIYLKTMSFTSSVNVPLFTFILLYARPCVEVFLGPSWEDSTPYMQAIAAWCIFRSIGNPIGSLLIGTGRVNRALASSVIVTVLVVLSATIAASAFGPVAIPYALAALYALLVPGFWVTHVRALTNIGFTRYHVTIFKPAAAAMPAGVCALFATDAVSSAHIALAIGCCTFFTVYGAASYYVNRDWMLSVMKMLKLDVLMGRLT